MLGRRSFSPMPSAWVVWLLWEVITIITTTATGEHFPRPCQLSTKPESPPCCLASSRSSSHLAGLGEGKRPVKRGAAGHQPFQVELERTLGYLSASPHPRVKEWSNREARRIINMIDHLGKLKVIPKVPVWVTESPINIAIPLESVSTPNSSQLMAQRLAQRNCQGKHLLYNGKNPALESENLLPCFTFVIFLLCDLV